LKADAFNPPPQMKKPLAFSEHDPETAPGIVPLQDTFRGNGQAGTAF